jgi:cell wall-associated NlpC family hydrolase
LSFASLPSDIDRQMVDDCIRRLQKQEKQPAAETMIAVAGLFLETPYLPNTLEVNDEEALVVNVQAFDCTTFVETCLALTLTLRFDQPGFRNYCRYLQKIRYRNGTIDGYTSRLHYATDWIHNNDSAGIIRDITRDLGGEQLSLQLDYMSTHASSYRHLEKHPCDVPAIRAIEAAINSRMFYYLPKNRIAACEQKIRRGDLLFFITSIPGLDASHVGIACRDNGRLTFIHASSTHRKVIVQPGTLAEYCRQIRSNRGIIVCRLRLGYADDDFGTQMTFGVR